MEIQYGTNTHGTLGCKHNTGLTTTVHNLLTQPLNIDSIRSSYNAVQKCMICDTHSIATYNIQHTTLDLNNSYATLMEYNTTQKI